VAKWVAGSISRTSAFRAVDRQRQGQGRALIADLTDTGMTARGDTAAWRGALVVVNMGDGGLATTGRLLIMPH